MGALVQLHCAGRAGRPVAGVAGRWTLRCQCFSWPPAVWCSGLAAIRSALHVRLGAARCRFLGAQCALDASMERPALGSSPGVLFSRGGDVALIGTSTWRVGQLWSWLVVRRRCRLVSFTRRRSGGRAVPLKSRRGGSLPVMSTRRFALPSELPALVWRLSMIDAPFGISEVVTFDFRFSGSLGGETGGPLAGMAQRGLVSGRWVWRWPAPAWRSNCLVRLSLFWLPGVGSGWCFLPASVSPHRVAFVILEGRVRVAASSSVCGVRGSTSVALFPGDPLGPGACWSVRRFVGCSCLPRCCRPRALPAEAVLDVSAFDRPLSLLRVEASASLRPVFDREAFGWWPGPRRGLSSAGPVRLRGSWF